jgi:hypothetical protein
MALIMKSTIKTLIGILGFITFIIFTAAAHSSPPVQCKITISGGKAEVCLNQPVILTGQLTDWPEEITTHEWRIDSKLLKEAEKSYLRIDTSIPGHYIVSYKTWHQAEEMSFCEIKLEVLPLPQITIVKNFSFFQRILFKKHMPQLKIISTENHTFQWLYNGQEIAGSNASGYKPRKAGKYQVIATNQAGCRTYSEIILIE